jgi:hypothetical protein
MRRADTMTDAEIQQRLDTIGAQFAHASAERRVVLHRVVDELLDARAWLRSAADVSPVSVD